jgi:signal transduction histidine kinase
VNEEMERELRVGIARELDPEMLAVSCRERLGMADVDAMPLALFDRFVRALHGDGHDIRLLRHALGFGEAIHGRQEPRWAIGSRLDALEDITRELLPHGAAASAPDPVRLRRILQSVRLAAEVGFGTAARVARMAEIRSLRHDLRNALGTIRNALELVVDAAPREAAAVEQLAAMATRNAAGVERLIRTRLADQTQLSPELGIGWASPHRIAERAVSAVASLARSRSIQISVTGESATVRLDAGALQFAFQVLLLAYLRGERPPQAIDVRIERLRDRECATRITTDSWTGSADSADGCELFWEIARGQRLNVEGAADLTEGVRVRLPGRSATDARQ